MAHYEGRDFDSDSGRRYQPDSDQPMPEFVAHQEIDTLFRSAILNMIAERVIDRQDSLDSGAFKIFRAKLAVGEVPTAEDADRLYDAVKAEGAYRALRDLYDTLDPWLRVHGQQSDDEV